MSVYNYSDGLIELNFEVYYESNKVDLINEIIEINLFDGDEEVSYDLKGKKLYKYQFNFRWTYWSYFNK